MLEVWKKWDVVHGSTDQQKRIASAKKAENTPISIDMSNGTATFSGSHGVYNTTLETCGCGDFIRRKLPCKHMYRLAIECNLMSVGAVKSDSKAIKAPDPTPAERKKALLQVVEMFESYTEEVQNKIREMIYHSNTGKLYPCENLEKFEKVISDGLVEVVQNYEQTIRAHTQKLTIEKLEAIGFTFPADLKTTKKARYEWCLANAGTVAPLAYPDFAFLQPAGLLIVAKKKAYTYLLRKLTDDVYIDEEGNTRTIPHGAEQSVEVSVDGVSSLCVQFPDDDITALLNKYGANRCSAFNCE